MRVVLMNCPINYEDEEETEVIKSKTNAMNRPVSPRKMVRWKNNLQTISHSPQECVGQNMSNLRKPSTDRQLGVARIQRRANNAQPKICKQ